MCERLLGSFASSGDLARTEGRVRATYQPSHGAGERRYTDGQAKNS